MVDVGGSFGRELSAKGEAAMIDFAITWLSGLYGTDMKSDRQAHATRRAGTRSRGCWARSSVAAPGAQPSRKILMEPLNNRIFFAGEAAHETLWGTVGGAWESGERAAEAAMRARPPMTARPKALIAWSSGKDSAWALHEMRRAGDCEIVGALTTVTETFGRVSMHGVRRGATDGAACGRRPSADAGAHSVSVPERGLRGAHGGGAGGRQAMPA